MLDGIRRTRFCVKSTRNPSDSHVLLIERRGMVINKI